MRYVKLLLILSMLQFCGSSPTLQLNLTGTTPFNDANVKDLVFTIENIPGSSGGLDLDHNGQADKFVFPSKCGSAAPAGCGFQPQHGSLEVGDIPLNFQYKVTVLLRGSTGNTLYSGTATFQNVKNAPAVTVAIN